MDIMDSDVPLSSTIQKVAILYNLKKGVSAATKDAEAEYDSIETVDAIRAVFERGGLDVVPIEADEYLPEKLHGERFDIAFNIAEGLSGRGREAQVPALLGMMGIPYTGSDETALCVALDKALTKRLLATYRVRVPKSRVLKPGQTPRAVGLSYPVIVKPNCEGSSKGIGEIAIARDAGELHALVSRNLSLYGEEMLAEEYIEGRECTVGLIGNGPDARIFEPMEIVFDRPTEAGYHIYSYPVKQDYTRFVHYECPMTCTQAQRTEILRMARKAFEALGCRDFARVDFRLDGEGRAYFIEINPLPGLVPGYSDYPMLAQFCGVSYDELVRGVLDAAACRLGMTVAWGGR